jgi:hypothetical protein
MKKTLVWFASFSVFACLIVLPVIRSVNASAGNYAQPAPPLIADGDPLPNPVPPLEKAGILVADGDPMPNPVPPARHFIAPTTIA